MTDIRCPICGNGAKRVVVSRPVSSGRQRWRLCSAGHRFSTIEVAVADHPRTLTALRLTTPSLDKQKLIQRVVAELEKSL